MLTGHFSDDHIGVAVLEGNDEVIAIASTADTSAHVEKVEPGQLGKDHLRGQRGGEALIRNVIVRVRFVSLILVVARKRIAQLYEGRWVQGQVVAYDGVAPIGVVCGVTDVPPAGECISGGEGLAGKGKAAEEVLLFALGPIHPYVEPLCRIGVQAGETIIVHDISRCGITSRGRRQVAFRHF